MRTTTPARALTAAALAFAPLAAPAGPAGGAEPPCPGGVPFVSGEDGYHSMRIPAVVRTPRGTLVAFAEGRRDSAADDGDIDVVARRSQDGGCTWGPLLDVADNGRDTVGNPAPVADPATGRLLLLTVRQSGAATRSPAEAGRVPPAAGRRVYLQRSTDDGESWSAPREITAQVERPGWRWYATGPGHGIALRRGPHRGRLIVPADHTGAAGAGAQLLYSDDHGDTWHLGAVDEQTAAAPGALQPNESEAAELPDGRIYVNSRNQSAGAGTATRLAAYSLDGGTAFAAPFRPVPELTAPVVQGSLLQLEGAGCRPLLFSAPEDTRRRRRLTVRRSPDGGAHWGPEGLVTEGPAGYSDLVQLGPGTAGVLYETGEETYHDRIEFLRFHVRCP